MKTQDLPITSAKKAVDVNPSIALLLPVLTIMLSSLIAQIPQAQDRQGFADRAGRVLEYAGRNADQGFVPSILSTIIARSGRIFAASTR